MTESKTAQLVFELRSKLREVFVLQEQGAGHELIRAQGYVDGYMRVLLESGLMTQAHLLGVVSEERKRAHGPAYREVMNSEQQLASA